MRILRLEALPNVCVSFMFHYRDFGCPLSVLAAILGFKLLQNVAGRRQIARLLQNVPNVFRTVATKNIPRFLSRNRSAKTYRLRAQFDDDTRAPFRHPEREQNLISSIYAHSRVCHAFEQF